MSCRKNLIIGFGIFLPVFVSVLLSSSCYAIEDFSVTLFSSSSNSIGVCHNTNPSSSQSGHACTDFSYIVFTTESDFSNLGNSPYISFDSNNRIQLNAISDIVVYSVPPNVNLSFFTNNPNTLPSGWSVTITLTDTFPGSSCSCPEVPECPAIPENPYDEKLDNITMAIYCCGGILLVLYFFYCIYRIIIKSSGVDRL